MKYLKGVLIIVMGIYSITFYVYPQTKSTQKSIISTKIVALRYGKQTDTLKIPVVADKYPALKNALSIRMLLGDNLKNVIKNYRNCGCGITSMDYEVTYENKGIISILISDETMAAYSDSHEQCYTLNIHTGKPYPLANEINLDGRNRLFNNYRDTLKKRILADKEEDGPDIYDQLKSAVDSLNNDDLFQGYVFTNEGLKLSMNVILPHVVHALEPDRVLVIPYKKLRPYKVEGAAVLK